MTDDLDDLVRDVTELTGADVPGVMDVDAPVLRLDAVQRGNAGFYLIGLIGGKEVGKTALVNALAGQTLSASTSYGPGTETVIAYAHEAQAGAVRELLGQEVPGQFQIVTHAVPRLTHQVLLDLPDVDSLYTQHLEITRRMLRHMLYPVWIQSVEKYADHQPLKLLAAVAAGNDPANFLFCLNKIDQVVKREGERAAVELREDFARRIARTLSMSDPPTVHLISAIQPDAHDLPALRDLLSRQKSPDAVRHAVDLAARQRTRTVLQWLDQQGLKGHAERLERLDEEASELTAERLGVPLLEQAVPRLLDDPGHRLTLVDEVMTRRVGRWPIVNILHTLLSPLTALWWRNTGAAGAPASEALVSAYVDGERPIAHSVQATFALLHQSHPSVSPLYRGRRLWEDATADTAAADLREQLAAALDRQRTTAVDRLAGRTGIIAPLVRVLLTVGAVLWFPFAQPVLETLLLSGWTMVPVEIGLLAVRLLSAAYLLQSAAFLAIWFGVLWLILRWDTHRKVARLLQRWKSADAADPSLSPAAAVVEWIDALLDPIRKSRQRAQNVVKRTEDLRQSLTKTAA